ncbi:MAG: DUF4091 domain-containing protein [Armatimonadetes bacterium]|nr:DUF4091 domain-containing protein [Armatimonadota bacterium]
MGSLLALVCICATAGFAQADIPFANTDFESDVDADNLPDNWNRRADETGSVSVDRTVAHSGQASLRIRHESSTSYSYVYQGVDNAWPGQRLVASVWVRCQSITARGFGPRLYCGYEGGLSHHAAGPVLDQSGNCDWQKITVPFNTRDKSRVEIYLYLHESTGTVWFDDLVVEPVPVDFAAVSADPAPSIDGLGDEALWRSSPAHPLVNGETQAPVEDASLRIAHDANSLYFLLSAPVPADLPPDSRLCVALDPEGLGQRILLFQLAATGERSARTRDAPIAPSAWSAAGQVRGGLWTAEFAIPLAAVSPGLETGHNWRINVFAEVPGQPTIELAYTAGKPELATVAASVRLPELLLARHRGAEVRARLDAIIDSYRDWAKHLPTAKVPREYGDAEEMARVLQDSGAAIEELSRRASTLAEADDPGWREMGRALTEAHSNLLQARAKALPLELYSLGRKFAGKPTWSVAIADSTEKVFRDPALFRGRVTDTVKLSAARGEAESFQIVLWPLTADITGCTVHLPANLVGPKGARVPGAAFDVRAVGYVKAEKPAYARTPDQQWWPDPLLPFAPADVAQGTVQPLWITVTVPRDAVAGLYRGRLTLKAEKTHAIALNLELQVRDFTLPQRPALATSFGMSASWISRYYLGRRDPQPLVDGAVYRRWCDELLRHRVSPYLGTEYRPQPGAEGKYQLQPWLDNAKHCAANGLTSMMLAIMPAIPGTANDYDDAFKQQFRADLAAMTEALHAEGLLGLAYVCAWDEPREASYEGVRAGHRLIREIRPDLRILQTVCYDDEPSELVGNVDIWCPITSRWNPEFYSSRQKAGEEIWWYVCCGPGPPYANFFIDQPALDHRVLFWQTWQRGVTGLLYWQTTWWEGNIPQGGSDAAANPDSWVTASHKVFKVNGDGHLLYPGAEKEPVPSIRLAVIRDGIEDYDYLALLQAKLGEARVPQLSKDRYEALLEVGPEISRSLTSFASDATVIRQRRDAIALALEALAGPKD